MREMGSGMAMMGVVSVAVCPFVTIEASFQISRRGHTRASVARASAVIVVFWKITDYVMK